MCAHYRQVRARGTSATRWRAPLASGFVLMELVSAAALLTLGAIWMATRLTTEVQDSGARATASYMLTVRGAVQNMLVQYFDYLTLHADGDDEVPEFLRGALPL